MPSSPDRASEARIAELEAQLRALREPDARARLILDSATDYAIITMDTQGCVTSWNAGARAIMGYTEAEIVGRSGEAVFTSERSPVAGWQEWIWRPRKQCQACWTS